MEEKLREAACFGDIEALTTLLNKGVDVNSQHKINGWTALHWAAKRNNADCVNVLLARGADRKIFTSKGELASQLTTNKKIFHVLGQSGSATLDGSTSNHSGWAEKKSANVNDPLLPNYLRHPPADYKVDVGERPQQQQQYQHQPPPAPAPKPQSAPTKKVSSSAAMKESSSPPPPPPTIRILKVRLVGKEEYDTDFIEIDVPAQQITFRRLIDMICDEFSIDPRTVVKLRKLPNTKLRRDAEVQRLTDYQEIEVEIADI